GGDLAYRVKGQGHLCRTELMGYRLRTGGTGNRRRTALCGLADGIFRRNSTRAGGVVDPAGRAGIRDVAGKAAGKRPSQWKSQEKCSELPLYDGQSSYSIR